MGELFIQPLTLLTASTQTHISAIGEQNNNLKKRDANQQQLFDECLYDGILFLIFMQNYLKLSAFVFNVHKQLKL